MKKKGTVMSRKLRVAVVAVFLSFLSGSAAQAALVDVFDVVGSATFDEGLELWRYDYTVFGDNSPNGLSHWWIELPPHKAETIQDPSSPPPGWPAEYPEFGEPLAISLVTALGTDLSAGHTDLNGIKWEAPDDSDFKDGELGLFSFYSSHAPAAEDAYTWLTKFGREGYDTGRTIGPNGNGGGPGETPVVPEPASLWLIGSGLGAMAFRRRKTSLRS